MKTTYCWLRQTPPNTFMRSVTLLWPGYGFNKQLRLTKDCKIPAGDDVSFYRGKLSACRYFFLYELPTVHTRLALLEQLDGTCLNTLLTMSSRVQPGSHGKTEMRAVLCKVLGPPEALVVEDVPSPDAWP